MKNVAFVPLRFRPQFSDPPIVFIESKTPQYDGVGVPAK
jgi:hypothetical protein